MTNRNGRYGEMLEQSWEKWATDMANCPNAGLAAMIATISKEVGIDESVKARVVMARDTRPSGPAMAEGVKKGIAALGVEAEDAGLLTTPQLHFLVRCHNDPSYGTPTEHGYNQKMAAAFLVRTSFASNIHFGRLFWNLEDSADALDQCALLDSDAQSFAHSTCSFMLTCVCVDNSKYDVLHRRLCTRQSEPPNQSSSAWIVPTG